MSELYETVGLTPHQLHDGRHAWTDEACANQPEITQFVKRFPNYYAYDLNLMAWVSPHE